MNTYSITGVTTTPNSTGNLIQLAFTYTIADETGETISRDIKTNYAEALSETTSYSDADLIALAKTDTDTQVYTADMENCLLNKRTPIYDPLVLLPALFVQPPDQQALPAAVAATTDSSTVPLVDYSSTVLGSSIELTHEIAILKNKIFSYEERIVDLENLVSKLIKG